MKKSIFILFLMSIISNNIISQEYVWYVYYIKVDRVNAGQVVSAMDKYLSKPGNLVDGVTVSLFEVMFANNDVDATHIISFTGSPDAMNAMYSSEQKDDWMVMMSTFDQLTESDGSAAGRSIHTFNSEASGPIHQIYMLDVAEPGKKADAFEEMWSTIQPDGRITLGQIVSGRQDGASHYVLATSNDFKDLVSGRSNDPKTQAAWAKYRKDGGATDVVSSQTRVLVKQWK